MGIEKTLIVRMAPDATRDVEMLMVWRSVVVVKDMAVSEIVDEIRRLQNGLRSMVILAVLQTSVFVFLNVCVENSQNCRAINVFI